jgi:hypothetical protein
MMPNLIQDIAFIGSFGIQELIVITIILGIPIAIIVGIVVFVISMKKSKDE